MLGALAPLSSSSSMAAGPSLMVAMAREMSAVASVSGVPAGASSSSSSGSSLGHRTHMAVPSRPWESHQTASRCAKRKQLAHA
ncbi:Os07g0610300 [Oryza sativa Japonica Group]|uniref:Os07g0610300 protein n=1 Tax=Oryza sativa subsp. japonica TaxID=39947 RepID=A0A0P0X8S5_ORYSJ|nr:Os07g0610300 [Oryza sativa Japonica Group]